MIIVNFSHPLTGEQMTAIETITGQRIAKVIDQPAQLDALQAFPAQVDELVARVPLSAQEWQTEALLLNLPSLNVIAALVLTELHGRMGYFPSVMRLRAAPGSLPPRFEVAEIINLQELRDAARARRQPG